MNDTAKAFQDPFLKDFGFSTVIIFAGLTLFGCSKKVEEVANVEEVVKEEEIAKDKGIANEEETVNEEEIPGKMPPTVGFSMDSALPGGEYEPNGYSETEATIEGTTLVYVPYNLGLSYTVPNSVTVIADNAFSDSAVTQLTFEDGGDQIVYFGEQSSWWPSGETIDGSNPYEENYDDLEFDSGSINVISAPDFTTDGYVYKKFTLQTLMNLIMKLKGRKAKCSASFFLHSPETDLKCGIVKL